MSVFPASMRYVGTVNAVSLWERFIGGIGLTLTLVGLVLLSVVMPLREGNWAPGMPSPLLVAVMGGTAGWTVYQLDWTVRRVIVNGGIVGVLLTVYAAASTAPGFPITVRAFNAARDIVQWMAAIPTEETQAGVIEFAMFLTLSVWLLCLFGVWWALRNAHGWTTVLFGGVVLAFALSNLPGGLGWRLGIFMASAVMLLIHLNAVRRIEEWRGRRAVFDAQNGTRAVRHSTRSRTARYRSRCGASGAPGCAARGRLPRARRYDAPDRRALQPHVQRPAVTPGI